MAIYRPGLRGASSSQTSMDCGGGNEERAGMVRNGQPELWDRWGEGSAKMEKRKWKIGLAQDDGCLGVGLNRGLVGEEDAVVDYAGQDAAKEGADPIDAVVGPVIARDEGGAEGAGRVDGGAGEGEAAEGVHGDGQADGEAGYFVEGALGVNAGGEENEDQEEGHHAFEEHAVQAREIGGERGSDGA